MMSGRYSMSLVYGKYGYFNRLSSMSNMVLETGVECEFDTFLLTMLIVIQQRNQDLYTNSCKTPNIKGHKKSPDKVQFMHSLI